MIKLLLVVIIEVAVGISLAGLALAVIVPLLNRYRPAHGDDPAASLVIVGVIVLVTAAVLLRPGSAINRRIRR